jgi:polyisoprenoid-binding protein YceI
MKRLRYLRGSVRPLTCMFVAAAALLPLKSAEAQSQRYTIDNTRSLVWWQVDPHLGHLWASTCPDDPSWQPGEGHSPGHYINYLTRPEIRTTHESEKRIPLFPRRTVRPNCRKAVSGTFTMADAKFSNATGGVKFFSDSLETGADFRNGFSKKYVFKSAVYPTVEFKVDSLTSVSMAGDTVNAVAVGTFVFRGVNKPTRVQVRGVPDPAGLRVRGTFAMPAKDLEDRYNVSSTAMGMGVGMKVWDTLFMGFDLILVPTNATSASP